MKKITSVLLTLVLAILVLAILTPILQHATDSAIDGVAAARAAREAELAKQEAVRTWQQSQQAQLDVEVAKANADTAADLAPIWQAAGLILAFALGTALVILAYGMVTAAITGARLRATLIHADRDMASSAFPLVSTPAGLITPEAPALATRTPAPAAITAPITTTALALPTAPTWSELRTTFTPTADRLLLGVATGGPVFAPLTGLLSVLIVGRPGSGKTTLLRLLAEQAVMAGATVVAWDLHNDMRLDGVELATTEDAIAASATAITTELDARRRNGRGAPVVVMVDELPLLARTVPEASTAVRRLCLEGRKFGLYCLLAGQGAPADLFDGGRLVRDATASRFVFRTSTAEARRAGLERTEAITTNTLPTGTCVLDGACVTRPTLVAVPRLDGAPPVMATTNGTTDQVARVRALRAAGWSLSAICREVYGTNGGHGFYEVRRALGLDV